MRPKFHLSNKQMKDCELRGGRLSIAIPLPDDFEDDEPMDFVRDVLCVPAHWIREARFESVPVIAPLHAPGGDGLTAYFGEIAHDHVNRKTIYTYRIRCIVAEVSLATRRRHSTKLQWPASIVVGEHTFPKPRRSHRLLFP